MLAERPCASVEVGERVSLPTHGHLAAVDNQLDGRVATEEDGLELHHPDHERIDAVLRSIGYAGNGIELKVDSAASPRLVAVCRGPDGRTVALSD